MTGEWRPIADAPRDGTEIDLWVVTQFIRQPERNTGARVANACWNEPTSYNSDMKSPGWMFWSSPNWESVERELSGGARYVTHWMPLPEPPVTEASAALSPSSESPTS